MPQKRLLSRHLINNISKSKYDFEANSQEFKNILKGVCRHNSQFSDLLWDLIIEFKNINFNYEDVLCSVHTSNKNNMQSEIQQFNFDIVSGKVDKFSYLGYSIFVTE